MGNRILSRETIRIKKGVNNKYNYELNAMNKTCFLSPEKKTKNIMLISFYNDIQMPNIYIFFSF